MQLKTASAIIIIGNLAWTASAQLRAHTRHTRELGTDCSQNNRALVSKYGRQLCPDEIQDKFTSRSEFPAFSGFLGKDPSFKDFVVNSKEYNSLTWEKVQSVCVTKCDKSPNCDLVSIEPKDGDKYSCITYKPSERPGGYLADAPESLGIITSDQQRNSILLLCLATSVFLKLKLALHAFPILCSLKRMLKIAAKL